LFVPSGRSLSDEKSIVCVGYVRRKAAKDVDRLEIRVLTFLMIPVSAGTRISYANLRIRLFEMPSGVRRFSTNER